MRFAAAVLFALVALPPAAAWSAPVTWQFVAIVASESPALGFLDDQVRGSITFDADLSDLDPDPEFALFDEAPIALRIVVDVPVFADPIVIWDTGPEADGQVSIGRTAGLPAVFAALVHAESPRNGIVSIELVDTSRAAFGADAIPASPPALSALDPFDLLQAEELGFTTRLTMQTNDQYGVPFHRFDAYFTELIVPEPATLPLASLGSGLLVALRLRRRHQLSRLPNVSARGEEREDLG